MNVRGRLTAATLALLLPVAASAAPTLPPAPAGLKIYAMGEMKMISDTKYMTLYTYDADKSGAPACYGSCAKNWPPLVASPDARPVGKFTIVKRSDGTRQWAYKGKPLYLSKRDENPGEMMGDGVGGKWHFAEP